MSRIPEQVLAELDRSLRRHPDAEVKNVDRLRCSVHPHATAVCRALSALLRAFADTKIVCLLEAEISREGKWSRPEDIVAWIQGVGVFVVEVKSHPIAGIRRFENNVPQVMYQGKEYADTDLLDQPRDFAYKLKVALGREVDEAGVPAPALYYAGWLPNVSHGDVAAIGAEVSPDKVWLSDMLDRETFLSRLPTMSNLTDGQGAVRESLEPLVRCFGATSGLMCARHRRQLSPISLGHTIDQRCNQLKRLTAEQESLAFSPNLLRGPKVIRGVAGSGKTVVLANAVADAFLRAQREPGLFQTGDDSLHVLVLCFNRALVPYLEQLILQCFDARKPFADWRIPGARLEVCNIDRFAYRHLPQSFRDVGIADRVDQILASEFPDRHRFDHVLVDEGQDFDLAWYPLLREVAKPAIEDGLSIVVFYDEAQNLYGMKRPGTGDAPAWKDLLGVVPNRRGLRTIMRVGHRNTNEILSFSFNMLLGAFAEHDPEMVTFSEMSQYEGETIPQDPSLDHPNAGRKCVEKLAPRRYRVHFAVHRGPPPEVRRFATRREVLRALSDELLRLVRSDQGQVDPSDLLVMTPTRAGVAEIMDHLEHAGIQCHCPIRLTEDQQRRRPGIAQSQGKSDPRDQPIFQDLRVTVSTPNSAKGYTAHVCYLVFPEDFPEPGSTTREQEQQTRAGFHAACTRATLMLQVWGTGGALLREAERAADDSRHPQPIADRAVVEPTAAGRPSAEAVAAPALSAKASAGTALLRAMLGPDAAFRDGQWEAIDCIGHQRRRMLVVQRTGWGKSIVYFLATKILRDAGAGPTLLISPLLSLMRNQIAMAARLGIRAETIHSENTDEWKGVEDRLRGGQCDVLMISPERLGHADFLRRLLPLVRGRIGLFVVDEAHCISDWGHDFRPDYRRILRVLRLLPGDVPVLCTTATANNRVVEDIVEQLPGLQVSRGPLIRSSLRLYNLHLADQAERLAWLAQTLPVLQGTGILYCLTVADTRRVAAWLQSQGIAALDYSADMTGEERVAAEQALIENRCKVLVATVALGMGFDKPDLGFVIHFQRPSSVVAYYQQVGRAGRALDSAFGVLLCGQEDDEISEYFIRTAFPPVELQQEVLRLLEADGGHTMDQLCAQLNHSRGMVEKALRLLTVEEAVQQEGRTYSRTANRWTPDPAHAERVTELRRAEREEMQRYVDHPGCLMEFLARALEDPAPTRCGRCMNCTGKHAFRPLEPKLVTAAVEFLRGGFLPLRPRVRWPKATLEALAQAVPELLERTAGGRPSTVIPESLQARPGRALCVWGDAGWGSTVAAGKYTHGRFAEDLVAASVQLLRERWRPHPFPTWVTSIPSLRRPGLVVDFAQRLAGALGIPYRSVLRKTRETPPQKDMQNSAHQVRNLAGAFDTTGPVTGEPVLLVDDMVDSCWTMTVAAALLLRAGSGPVFPFALATARPRGD